MTKKEVLIKLIEESPVYTSHPELLAEYLIYNRVSIKVTKGCKRNMIYRYLKLSFWFTIFMILITLIVCIDLLAFYLLFTWHWYSIFLLLTNGPLIMISCLFFNKFMENLHGSR